MAGGLLRFALLIAAPYCPSTYQSDTPPGGSVLFSRNTSKLISAVSWAPTFSPNYVRVTIGTMEENTRFIEVLKKLL
jgi:hypothetical protein